MARTENWPVVHSGNITIGNPDSNVAIATLWTPRQKIEQFLDPSDYAVIGQLYMKAGIPIVLRNLLSNTNIRHLLVCGADLSGTGDALVRLWRQGVNSNHNIMRIEKA